MKAASPSRSKHLARSNNVNRVDRNRDERHEVLESVARAAEHDDSQLPFGEILLELKIAISRHEDGEARGFGRVEQLSVLQPGPRLLLDRSNVVPGQKRRELPRKLFIEENAHAPLPPHGLLPAPQRLALSRPSETRPGIRRDCGCVRDSQSSF